MGIVLSAKDLKKGKTGAANTSGAFIQPLQFLPLDEKTDEWKYTNMDFLEYQGLRQIWHKAPLLSKNYNLSKGIIDHSDYMSTTAPDNKDLLDSLLSQQEQSHLDLRFYPIIPNFVNTVCTEFAKRNTKISFRTTDENSYNELLEMKRGEIEKVLLSDADRKMRQKMIESGLDINDPANQEQVQQQLNPENLKTLPEIEGFFKKNYRSMVEEWAAHQHQVDVDRFSMNELEERNFRNSIITDSEYWHFRMMEDDYDIEIWNPMFTFVNKAPETRYTSQAHSAGNIQLMTIPDVIDKYGYIMDEDQLLTLETIYPQTNAVYSIAGLDPQSSYDSSKSHAWNVNGPSLAMRQLTSTLEGYGNGDMVSQLLNQNNSIGNGQNYLVRVCTAYWKSQRRVGHLTQIKDSGEVVIKIVDETYDVTSHPVYDNVLVKNRNTDTLIFGEHIDWIWINQVWGGVKIGPNIPSYWGMTSTNSNLQPMYIGICQNKIGPLKYQFKGDKNLYGCKLPVEGATFSDYNTRSTCAVDLLKPFQIGYNVVNNQIADILMDELGTIVALDQNQLPQKSLNEDWGKGNYAKAWVAMKNFNVLPLDKTLANVDGVGGQSPLQVLNLEQTNRLMSRIQLANYFKNEGLSLMGITPQRLGQPVGRQTATGVEENLNASYNQTEMYFIQHSDYLMPRVHQQRTDLAQYYNSNKPSVRLQYMTSKEEKVNFQINGTDLLLKDINVYCVAGAVNRGVMEELRKLLITNNTAGASIYDLGNLITADSLGEMNSIFKNIEKNVEAKRLQDMQAEKENQAQAEQASLQERRLELEHEEREAEKNRRNEVLIAEIRAAGYSGAVDLNANKQNDFLDNLDRIQNQTEYSDTMNFEREKENNRGALAQDKANLEREKMNNQLKIKEYDLAVARENKNSFDLKKNREKKLKDKEKAKNKKK